MPAMSVRSPKLNFMVFDLQKRGEGYQYDGVVLKQFMGACYVEMTEGPRSKGVHEAKGSTKQRGPERV